MVSLLESLKCNRDLYVQEFDSIGEDYKKTKVFRVFKKNGPFKDWEWLFASEIRDDEEDYSATYKALEKIKRDYPDSYIEDDDLTTKEKLEVILFLLVIMTIFVVIVINIV